MEKEFGDKSTFRVQVYYDNFKNFFLYKTAVTNTFFAFETSHSLTESYQKSTWDLGEGLNTANNEELAIMKDLHQKKLQPSGNRLIIYSDDYSKIAIAKFSFDFVLESVHPLKMKNAPKRDDKIMLYQNKLYIFTPRNNITEVIFDDHYEQKDVNFNAVHSSIFDFAITRDKFMTKNDE